MDINEEKEINLCEILKGHEGEFFYSPLYGNVKLVKTDAEHMPIEVKSVLGGYYHSFTAYGKYLEDDWGGECVLFPSKTQRDWNKWIKEQKPKVPKIWSELEKTINPFSPYLYTIDTLEENANFPIERSVLAHLKIYQLIEVGYGGNVTNEEWLDNEIEKFIITLNIPNCRCQFTIVKNVAPEYFNYIAFHTKEQAEEFLKYPENVQLLKDYFMI